MSTLPGSYVTGVVIFNAMVSLGDVNGDAIVDSARPSGVLWFHPHNRTYKSMGTPTMVVGNEPLKAQLVEGRLVNANGQPWYALPIGLWRVSFQIDSVPVPSITIDVKTSHTFSEPLDIGSLISIDYTDTDRSLANTNIAITDTGDGGYEIESQNFEYADGAPGELVVEDTGDGGALIHTV